MRLPNLKKTHINAFPSVHLKKFDGVDLFFKFSSELLVVVLALLVGIFNIGFFHFGAKTQSDNSYAFAFLSNHTPLNSKYYGKQTSISTVVVNGSGFIAQAHADDFLTGLPQAATEESSANSAINYDSLVQPTPDSVKTLCAKQIKTYTASAGDTLRSVAIDHDITIQTLIDANNLTRESKLTAGQQLIILPSDGILYTATDNDTLPDVAKKFSGDLQNIITFNCLDSAEDITGGQQIFIPGGHLPLPPAPKPTPKPKVPVDKSKVGGTGPVDNVPVTEGGWNEVGHTFPKGYCTWYVAQKLHGLVKWGGNAKNWLANSKAYGAVVDMDPAPGTIVVTNDSKKYGHVAYVEKVTDHSIVVSEMNFEKFGKIDFREIPLTSSSIKGYIHP